MRAPTKVDRAELEEFSLAAGSSGEAQTTTDHYDATAPLSDLTKEWLAAAMASTRNDFDELIARGVPSRWLWLGPARFGVSRVNRYAEGFYEPATDGQRCLIIPAVPLPEDLRAEDHDFDDLLAFTLSDPTRWWRRFGTVPILNAAALERAEWLAEPVKIWRSPLAWLRARGAGVVILDPDVSLRFHLGGVREILAEDLDLAEVIDQRLRVRPDVRVLVPELAGS